MGILAHLKNQIGVQTFIAKKTMKKEVSTEDNITILNETTNLQGAFIFLLFAMYFDNVWLMIAGGIQVLAGLISFFKASFRVWSK